MARLILTFNNKILKDYRIAPEEQLTIGRNADNRIFIDNMAISGHHATVRLQDNKLIVSDLGSRNGTLVNNERITVSQLAHQDWVTIGKHILIVDLHETLSLESTADKLMGLAMQDDGDQTIMLDKETLQSQWVGFDYLSFRSTLREDLELTGSVVTIGKNQDADIRISGLWALLAGAPSATITRENDEYILEHVGGGLKLKINGARVIRPTKLNHEDIVKIGPVEVQVRRVRRPSM